MKDLPKVFEGKVNNIKKNTQDIFYGSDRGVVKQDSLSVIRKINNIFASPFHVYKSKVKITLKDRVIEKTIVGKTSTNLLTMTGEQIKITDILDIEKI